MKKDLRLKKPTGIDIASLDGVHVSTQVAAQHLGVTKACVVNWINDGTLPSFRVDTGARPYYAVPMWAVVIAALTMKEARDV